MVKIERVLSEGWELANVKYDGLVEIIAGIPGKPGIYQIATNTPKSVLSQFGSRQDTKHYNLNKKISASDMLPDLHKIVQKGDDQYVVYTGHSYNLKQRFREHYRGSKGTGCLALFQLEELRKYKWSFSFNQLKGINDYNDSKLYRTFLEQRYRAKIGWPILCSQ